MTLYNETRGPDEVPVFLTGARSVVLAVFSALTLSIRRSVIVGVFVLMLVACFALVFIAFVLVFAGLVSIVRLR